MTTNQRTFTPPPWLTSFDEPVVRPPGVRSYILRDNGGHELMLLQRLPEVSQEEHDYNVRLITQAPRLLAELERARRVLDNLVSLVKPPLISVGEEFRMFTEIDEAIAEARRKPEA